MTIATRISLRLFAAATAAMLLAASCGGSAENVETTTPAASTAKAASEGAASAPTNITNEEYKTLSDGITKAWALTQEGYSLMGGRPSIASETALPVDKFPAAAEKFEQSLAVLDETALPRFPHSEYPIIYTHADYVRGSNLHALAMISLAAGNKDAAESLTLKSLALIEGSFELSSLLVEDAAYYTNARECAALGVELHSFAAFFKMAAGDKAASEAHQTRATELVDWISAHAMAPK